jgi:hypothetical protein
VRLAAVTCILSIGIGIGIVTTPAQAADDVQWLCDFSGYYSIPFELRVPVADPAACLAFCQSKLPESLYGRLELGEYFCSGAGGTHPHCGYPIDWPWSWNDYNWRGTVYYYLPKNHVIKLSRVDGIPESGAIVTSTEPGNSTNLIARVYDQAGTLVPNVNVRLEVDAVAASGGHPEQHHPNRPKGLLSNGIQAATMVDGNTGADGFRFTFLAPAPAGDHKMKATCTDRACTPEGPDTVWVGVCPTCSPKGLVPLTPSGSYELVGFTPSHPVNSHNLKPDVSAWVRALANVYRSRFPQDPVLHLNDASLERGGLFDSDAHKGKPWQPPHPTHRKGTDIDIRWNPTKHPTTSIPDGNVDKFKEEVSDLGGKAVPAYVGTDNQHFHVQFGE